MAKFVHILNGIPYSSFKKAHAKVAEILELEIPTKVLRTKYNTGHEYAPTKYFIGKKEVAEKEFHEYKNKYAYPYGVSIPQGCNDKDFDTDFPNNLTTQSRIIQ